MFRIKKYTLLENALSLLLALLISCAIFPMVSSTREPIKNGLKTGNEIDFSQYIVKKEEVDKSIFETDVDIVEEMYYDSIEYLAMCVEAEAGNQDEYGKRLVADVIINRFNNGEYANFYEVINEKNQFAVVENESIFCVPSEETYRVVAEELENLTNDEVLYFRTDYYHDFATDLFKHGAHYFSK